jgi:hypothetical protein
VVKHKDKRKSDKKVLRSPCETEKAKKDRKAARSRKYWEIEDN